MSAALIDPHEIFERWFDDAKGTALVEPNAMVLSTVDEQGKPSSRVVLLKRIENGVYYFFTNYDSRKSQAIAANPYAALNFHWRLPVHRQVRIEGPVVKASKEISEEYFRSRARGSQIGAWASPQSHKIENRKFLEERVKKIEERFQKQEGPLPENWGGFGVVPERFEFWQEGENRLHHRRLFVKAAGKDDGAKDGSAKAWREDLLAP